jgi:amino acid transporter
MARAESTLMDPDQRATLQRNAIGLLAVVFIAITTAGPALSADSGLVFSASYAGGATPLAVLLATVAILFVAVCLGQLGKHLPSAGGLSTYAVNGLGRSAGYITGWLLVLGYILIPPLVVLVFSYVAQANLTASFGAPTWIWAPIAVVVAIVGWALTYRGIKISTEVGVVLGALELLIFLAFAAYLIVDAGSRNTLQVFSPHLGNTDGMGSVFVAMIYAVLAFIGFDGAAAIAEETRQPKRNIPRALIGSAVAMGAFWLICYYAAVVWWGPTKIISPTSGFIAFNGGDPWSGMARQLWGGAWILILIAVLSSAFASSTGSILAGSRIGYTLGRSSLLPTPVSRIHPRFRTPTVAITLQTLISVGLMLGLGFGIGGPLNAFGFIGTVLTILFVVIYGLAAVASFAYYLRRRRGEFNIALHFLCPLLALLFLIPVLIASFGINFAGLGIAPLAGDSRWGPLVAAVWLVAGVGLLIWFRAAHPDRLGALGRLFGEDPVDAPEVDPDTALSRGPSVTTGA